MIFFIIIVWNVEKVRLLIMCNPIFFKIPYLIVKAYSNETILSCVRIIISKMSISLKLIMHPSRDLILKLATQHVACLMCKKQFHDNLC